MCVYVYWYNWKWSYNLGNFIEDEIVCQKMFHWIRDTQRWWWEVVGCLIYLLINYNKTRYITCSGSGQQKIKQLFVWYNVKRIIQYLSGTVGLGLEYSNETTEVIGFLRRRLCIRYRISTIDHGLNLHDGCFSNNMVQ